MHVLTTSGRAPNGGASEGRGPRLEPLRLSLPGYNWALEIGKALEGPK